MVLVMWGGQNVEFPLCLTEKTHCICKSVLSVLSPLPCDLVLVFCPNYRVAYRLACYQTSDNTALVSMATKMLQIFFFLEQMEEIEGKECCSNICLLCSLQVITMHCEEFPINYQYFVTIDWRGHRSEVHG